MRENTDDTVIFCYATFNIDALCSLATASRNEIHCSCDSSQQPMSGSFDWAVTVQFEDGVKWIMRSPRSGYGQFPSELSGKLLASEAATLKYLRQATDIPITEVYSYSASSNHPIGVPYILMSKAQGWPLQNVWTINSSVDRLSLTDKAKIMFQLGQITWKLAQVRFDRIGSLFEENNNIEIGECMSRGHILHERYSLDELPRGPFTTESEFYNSLRGAMTQHAECLRLTPHCFIAPIPSREDYENDAAHRDASDLWNGFVAIGDKLDSAENRLDYILAADALQDLIVQRTSGYLTHTLPNPFPLHHPDLSVNDIFVDDDFNITSIIDWSFCSSVPLAILLAPPGLPQSRDSLSKDLIKVFREGYKEASRPNCDKERRFLSSNAIAILEDSEFSWCLIRLLTFVTTDDLRLFHTLWNTVHPDYDLETFITSQRQLPHYVRLYEEMQAEDQPISKTRRSEKDYFGNAIDFTVAQNLTVVSNWGFRFKPHLNRFPNANMFIGNSKLWTWVLKAKEQRDL
ncbi:Aminoglycoside phosphotransferase [Penicillium concentricum]|uniref:Aminoglycoside phosphotransferase n=1 Tax=Penicillium concentricum TaxID=293559 RepID=A0A9W9S6P1_9EURO|nr:Aminoglycoside phosphotransferase [Penicillium concentricum]KAJ5373057.1 Aminoglycoside phosphotransferase [Penicillium concentricum]